jgi:acetolactate synthase-1/2/3 large subunit
VDSLALYEEIARTEGLRSVIVRNEATAGFAADAFFRVSGRVAACVTTGGPGVAYAAVALGEANAAASSFLHVSTGATLREKLSGRTRGIPHWFEHQERVVEPLTKESRRVETARDAAFAVLAALRAAQTPPFAPVFIELPKDLLSAPDDAPYSTAGQPADANAVMSAPALPADVLMNALANIAAAETPLIWVGTGALQASAQVLRFAELIDAPVILSLSARRRFPCASHPLVGTYPAHEEPVRRLIEESDCIVALGSDLDVMSAPPGLRMRQIVHVNLTTMHVGRSSGDTQIVADVGQVLGAWLEACPRKSQRDTTGSERAATMREGVAAELAHDEYLEGLDFVSMLDNELPEDAVIVCDMALAGYWAAGYLPIGPSRQVIYPMGWGTLGYGLSASIGAACAKPQSRTVLVSGDAGIQYFLGELATVVENALPLTIVVVDDSGYGMLRAAEDDLFGRRFAADLAGPTPAALGSAFGIPVNEADLGTDASVAALRSGLAAKGPSIVWLHGSLPAPAMSLLFRQSE